MQLIRVLKCMFALLLSPLFLTSQAAGQANDVNAQQIEVRLVADKPAIMLGEPIHISFIVQNNSDRDLQVLVGGDYRNALGRPDSFTVAVVREDGRRVPQPVAGPGFGGLLGPQKLAAGGSYTFKLFLPHWATFEEVGNYTIVAKRILKLGKYTADRWDFRDKTTDVEAQATANIEVVPQDSERMGALIEGLGSTMLSARNDKAGAAASTLSSIQDERVIPFFVKALEANDYEMKFRALGALSKFNDEAAFQALKKAMETKGEDIGNTATKEVANQAAENIRHAAAIALSKSPHPEAVPFLLSKRNDTSEGVRLTVLHVLGTMKPEEAIPILREMMRDKSKMISDEAKRYLKLLSPKE